MIDSALIARTARPKSSRISFMVSSDSLMRITVIFGYSFIRARLSAASPPIGITSPSFFQIQHRLMKLSLDGHAGQMPRG